MRNFYTECGHKDVERAYTKMSWSLLRLDQFHNLNLAFQIKQNPLKVGKENASFAGVLPVLDAKVRVLTEKEAYPILSFVADVGGILGLFIGFNFLMVWGVIVKCVPYFLKS